MGAHPCAPLKRLEIVMLNKILYILNFVKTTLVYIIYPPICPLCREIVDERYQFCPDCANKILRLDVQKNPPDILSGVFAITKYHGGTRSLLRKLKFDNNLNVMPAFHKILADISSRTEIKNFLSNIDLATYVPLHADRLKERGYNQVELIFRDWLIAQDLTAENLLIRKKYTPKLFKYSPAERKEILKGAFSLAEGADIRGKNILIVDDIYTTGATTAECAAVLKNAGAAKIFVMALASDFGD